MTKPVAEGGVTVAAMVTLAPSGDGFEKIRMKTALGACATSAWDNAKRSSIRRIMGISAAENSTSHSSEQFN